MPRVGQINWSGEVVFRAVASIRAGVVEVADVEVLKATRPAKRSEKAVEHFRVAVLRALADYHCAGDHIFEQEFQFILR